MTTAPVATKFADVNEVHSLRRAFVFAALVAAAVALAPAKPARALSPCPTSQFSVLFGAGSAAFDAEDTEILDAGVNRSRQCNVSAFELIVEGDLENEASLSAQRVSAVRNALTERGVASDRIQAVNRGRPTSYGPGTASVPDQVIVMIYFDYGRAPADPNPAPQT